MRAMGACESQRTTLWSRTFPSILKEIDPSYWTQVSGCQTTSPAACLHLLVWGPCELHFYLHLPRCCSQSLRANLVPVLTLSLSSSAVAGVTRMSVDTGRTRGWVPPSSFSSVVQTESGRSWESSPGAFVPSSVAATAPATSGPSHIKAFTSFGFTWILAWSCSCDSREITRT